MDSNEKKAWKVNHDPEFWDDMGQIEESDKAMIESIKNYEAKNKGNEKSSVPDYHPMKDDE